MKIISIHSWNRLEFWRDIATAYSNVYVGFRGYRVCVDWVYEYVRTLAVHAQFKCVHLNEVLAVLSTPLHKIKTKTYALNCLAHLFMCTQHRSAVTTAAGSIRVVNDLLRCQQLSRCFVEPKISIFCMSQKRVHMPTIWYRLQMNQQYSKVKIITLFSMQNCLSQAKWRKKWFTSIVVCILVRRLR